MTEHFNPQPKGGAFVSETLRKFAKGKQCQMMSEWCNGDPETVTLCHSRRRANSGLAQKPHDFWGFHGCSACNDNTREHMLEDRELYDAIRRTQYLVFAHFGTVTP